MKWGSNFGSQLRTSKNGKRKVRLGPILEPFFGEICLERPPRAAKSDSNSVFLAPRASKGAPRATQDAFSNHHAAKLQSGAVYIDVDVQNETPGPQKS